MGDDEGEHIDSVGDCERDEVDEAGEAGLKVRSSGSFMFVYNCLLSLNL